MDTPGNAMSFLARQTPCPQCGSGDAWVLPGPQGKTATVYCAQCRIKLTTLTRPNLQEMTMPKGKETVAPPSAPMLTAEPKPEPDDIPEPTVPPAAIEPLPPATPATLPENFGAHEALLQGFCQHLQTRLHRWMMDEHHQLTQGMDITMSGIRDYALKVLQCNEHAEYQLAHALETLQVQGLPLLNPPYQAVLQARTPAGYAITLTLTKSTAATLVEELGRLEGWLQAQGYSAGTEPR